MYTIAPRVRSRCQYVCASCLNATTRRAEGASPRLFRQNSTIAAASHTAENETPKSESTGPPSLASWLQKSAKDGSGSAQAGQPDKKVTPLKPSSSSQGAKSATKNRPQASLADQADKTTDDSNPSSSSKGAQATTKKLPKGNQTDSTDQTAKPRKTSSSKSRNRRMRRKNAQTIANDGPQPSSSDVGAATKTHALPEPRRVSSTAHGEPVARRVSTSRGKSIGRPAQLPAPLKILKIKSKVLPPGMAPRSRTLKRAPKTKRSGPLLSYLYSITSHSAGKIAKKVLMNILEERKLLNSRGLKMAQEGENIFQNAASKDLETTDQTLSTTLLKTYQSLESALKTPTPETSDAPFNAALKEGKGFISGSIHAQSLKLVPVEKPQPPVPGLVCGLERVLFNQGVYRLRDPHSRVYNFDPYLESITPVKEFDYNALKEYITSSRDKVLIDTAVVEGSKYTGSTSSMTSALAHFHYLLSKWRPVNLDQLSRGFPKPLTTFSAIQRAPASIFLRRRDGVYAIDANKGFDTSNVLQWLGKSMEKFLTSDKEEYMKYRKEQSHNLTDEDKNSPESYHYTTFGDFLMRSQLDAHDPRLPGTGMYDLKTRAVVSIRRDATDYEEGLGYEITSRHGEYDSYEREYYDMARAAFLKYSLQVRMGRMDGIFVAFHNTERIFGFQYLPLPEMDQTLHGSTDTTLGDSEFKVSLELLNKVLDRATEKFPGESLEVQFETRPKGAKDDCFMYIFARPVTEDNIQAIQQANIKQIQEYERRVIGLDGDSQEAVIRAAIESAAEASDAADQKELLEAAFDSLDESASVETIRKAIGTVEKGTPVENALNKMLDLVAARTEDKDVEATIIDANEAIPDSSVEKADTMAANVAPDSNATTEDGDRVAAFKLNIRNLVNGREVIRPNALKPTDEWKVDYSLEEIGGGVNKLYEASAKRRKESLGGVSVSPFMNNKYGANIQDNVKKGREYRKKMDRLDEEHGVEVYDKQEFLNFESLERREAEVRKDLQEETEELKNLKKAKEQATKV
ncbi:hypothetical protein V494_05182 [Pseudogymnoascus sp. VKM F-4513 (FW-928)]|nr:hypothetical protein V494_05182 [Pseudogymnoascus sp. VKM F-4513 (FW-928)]